MTTPAAPAKRLPLTTVLVRFAPEDNSENRIGTFVEDIAEMYRASFAEPIEMVVGPKAATWGPVASVGLGPDPVVLCMAFISPRFAERTDLVEEIMPFSDPEPGSPVGRLMPVMWDTATEDDEEEAIEPFSQVEPGTERYTDFVRDLAFWIRGKVTGARQRRPAETEVAPGYYGELEERPLGKELALEAREYSRLSKQILTNADALSDVSVEIFDGLERLTGSDWSRLDVEGAEEFAAVIAPRLVDGRKVAKRMGRTWKEAKRLLLAIHEQVKDSSEPLYKGSLRLMVRDLADALDGQFDDLTMAEAQLGAEVESPFQPAFKALLRAIRTRHRIVIQARSLVAQFEAEEAQRDATAGPGQVRPI